MSRALRSLLFIPGDSDKKLGKVAGCGADAVILDLEDAVPDADKVATRPRVRAALAGIRGALVCVRVNGLDTGLTAGDVAGVTAPGLECIVLPKTEAAAHVRAVDELIEAAEERAGLPVGRVRILPLVETARGLLRAEEIAAASPRVVTLAFGSGDFTRDLDLSSVRWSVDGAELAYARAHSANPLVFALQRLVLVFIFLHTLDSFGLDWTAAEVVPLVIAMVLYKFFFGSRRVLQAKPPMPSVCAG